MTYDSNFIKQQHAEYQAHRIRWKFLYDSYRGGADYSRGGYLTRYAYESQHDYASRLAQTPLDNHAKSIISIYNSFIFAEPPRRNFGTLADDALVASILEDADLEGRSWDAFMREVDVVAAVFGSAWVIVDKPEMALTTRADEIAGDVRPYVNLYMPLAVIDWDYQRQPNGRYEISYVKVLLNSTREEEEYAIYYPDRTDIIRASAMSGDSTQVSSTPNPLGYVPAVCVYSTRSNIRGIGISDINDIADVQRAIYDELSEIEQLIRISNHPSLVSTQEVQAAAGAGARIIIPENTTGDTKPYLLQPNSQSLDGIRASIQDKVAAINQMANLSSVRATATRSISGVAMETEYRLLNSHLTLKADNLELGEEQIWTMIFDWMGYPGHEFDIDYPESFNTRDRISDLVLIEKARSVLSMPTSGRSDIDEVLMRQVLDIVVNDDAELKQLLMATPPEDSARTYPDGEPIDPRLPEAYQLATNPEVPPDQNCANCEYYQQGQCSAWGGATVRPTYWCARWLALEQEEEEE